jgi:hypothetical protein
VASGLAAPRDEDVGAGFQRLPRHVFGLYLANQPCTGGVDARREWPGIAERQHDRTRLGVERDVQQFGLLGKTPGNEADAECCAGVLFELGGFLHQPRPVAIAAA